MRRLLSPFLLVFTSILGLAYYYAASQLTSHVVFALFLALPFICIWLVPILYWSGDRAETKPWTHHFQTIAYVSMGWLNFVFVALIPLNLLSFTLNIAGRRGLAEAIDANTPELTLGFSIVALLFGFWRARSGPGLKTVPIPIDDLDSDLHNLTFVQISDLHVGPTIRKHYVERVVRQCNALKPDLIVLTGDIVDGSISDLREHAAPLKTLNAKYGVYLILGNHDYYSGADAWVNEFRAMGITVLLNSHVIIRVGSASFMLAGVLDPAVQQFSKDLKPDPHMARGNVDTSQNMLRILLAHNPKLAILAEHAGFHLQISGHTHAGQFIPWTLITKWVHAPHYVGLSRQKNMWVYVSAGTGSWGPPIRLGTSPELSLLKLEHSGAINR